MWGVGLLKGNKGHLFFAIAKGGLNELNCIGTGASDHFVNISSDQVCVHVEFVLFDYCFFLPWGPSFCCEE